HKISAFERKILRKIFRLEYTFPSHLTYKKTNTTPITDRLTKLQQNYINRTLNSTNEIAIQTLHTSHKLPTNNNRLINRIPKNPIRKLRHPPTALLSKLYPDLSETLQDIVENTPVSMR
ncbi:unnamed protein product, partial [Tenebrio molitor]